MRRRKLFEHLGGSRRIAADAGTAAARLGSCRARTLETNRTIDARSSYVPNHTCSSTLGERPFP